MNVPGILPKNYLPVSYPLPKRKYGFCDDVETKHKYRDKEYLSKSSFRESTLNALAGDHTHGCGYHGSTRNQAELGCQEAVALKSKPKLTVGRPSPITPFTPPASKNVPAIAATVTKSNMTLVYSLPRESHKSARPPLGDRARAPPPYSLFKGRLYSRY